jgi:predicted negative regulator of RcsB-dependent stress response
MSTEPLETVQGTSSKASTSEPQVDVLVERVRSQAKPVIAGVVVIVLIVVGYWWYSSNQAERNAEAATQLSRVRGAFEVGEFNKALVGGDSLPMYGADKVMGLLDISEQYEGTDAGAIAALMAGNALANLGRIGEAAAQFERAQSSDAEVVKVGAMKGLALVQEDAGNYAEAAGLYEKAAIQGAKTGLEDDCYYKAGLCFEKAKSNDKAAEMYRMVVKKFEMSESAGLARLGLARLGMGID